MILYNTYNIQLEHGRIKVLSMSDLRNPFLFHILGLKDQFFLIEISVFSVSQHAHTRKSIFFIVLGEIGSPSL